jgi:hypothetical protein
MIIPSIVTLLTLCGRRNKQSQFPRETDDSESSFNLERVNLTHTLGTSKDRSEATVCFSFRVMEQGHHKRLQDRTHTNCAGHTSVARLHDRTPVRSAERTPAHRCVRKTKLRVVGGMSTCRTDWLLGLTLYHISRHVASTFKYLATTTTCCDLNNFYPKQTG